MDEDFVPNFTYKSQTGELANGKSAIASYNDSLVISHNNYLEIWDVNSKEIIKRIGTEKKEIITSFCTMDDMFILGYENGTIRSFNYDNVKIFGFKRGTKVIRSLFQVNDLLYIGTAGRVCSYDVMKNEIVREYEKQKTFNLPIMYNNTYFVCYAIRKFYVYQYNTVHPIHIHEVEEEVISFCVFDELLIFLSKNGMIMFFDLSKRVLLINKLHIKKAHSVCELEKRFYVLTSRKLIYPYEITAKREDREEKNDGELGAERVISRGMDDLRVRKEIVSNKSNSEVIDKSNISEEQKDKNRAVTNNEEIGETRGATDSSVSGIRIRDDICEAKLSQKTTGDCVSVKIKDLQPIGLRAKAVTSIGRDIYAIDADGKITLAEKLEHKMSFLCYHKNEIMQIKICDNTVFTLSEEKLIKWKVAKDEMFRDTLGESDKDLVLVNSRELKLKTSSMCMFNGYIVLGDCEELSFYDAETLDLNETKRMSDISTINSGKNYLGIARNNELLIMNQSLHVRHTVVDESDIIFVKFSEDEKLVGVSNYTNKINIYKLHSMELVMCLYGHSLPVRYFDFSCDSRSIISCSADKLVKLWGTEFGECRKTFYLNSHCVMFMRHNKDLFLAADNDIHYHRKNERIKCYKNFDVKYFDYNDEYLVAAGKFSIYLYEMDRYEFVRESSSESEGELEIENVKLYDKFSRALEKAKEDGSYDELFDVIKELDMGEMNNIISGLDNSALIIVLKALESNINYNTVLAVKVFFSIVEHHRSFVTENETSYTVYKELQTKVESLRQLIKDNDERMSVQKKFIV